MPQQKFKVEDGLLVRGQANVTGDLRVEGNTALIGNVTTNVTVGGNVTPTTDNTFYLGNTTNRWIIYAQSIDLTQPIISTNTASFGNNITISGNLNFTANGYQIGNNTSQVVIVTSTTSVSNTLTVGSGGNALTVNSSVFRVGSNIQSNGTTISIASGAYEQSYIAANNLAIATGLPSTIFDEVDKTTFNAFRYFIRVTSNGSNTSPGTTVAVSDMYTSEIILSLQGNTIYVSEYGQVFSNTRFMNFAAVTTDTKIRLVANSFVSNVNFTAVRTALK